jgi:RimJ/RimL family protein N-acetyltransferase
MPQRAATMRTELETERLVLRLPRLDDADAWSEATGDPEVMRFIGGSAGAASQSIELFLERWRVNGFGQYAIERREDGAFLGRLGLLVWDTRGWRRSTLPEAGDAGEVELGWALLREHWGRGYATEAAEAVRDAAWTDLDRERLVSLIHPDNTNSIHVARRLGAQFERDVESVDVGPLQVWVHPR